MNAALQTSYCLRISRRSLPTYKRRSWKTKDRLREHSTVHFMYANHDPVESSIKSLSHDFSRRNNTAGCRYRQWRQHWIKVCVRLQFCRFQQLLTSFFFVIFNLKTIKLFVVRLSSLFFFQYAMCYVFCWTKLQYFVTVSFGSFFLQFFCALFLSFSFSVATFFK